MYGINEEMCVEVINSNQKNLKAANDERATIDSIWTMVFYYIYVVYIIYLRRFDDIVVSFSLFLSLLFKQVIIQVFLSFFFFIHFMPLWSANRSHFTFLSAFKTIVKLE